MITFRILVAAVLLILPVNVYAGLQSNAIFNTDLIGRASQVTGPYDLRNRDTHIQISNLGSETVTIHIQIFQHDRDCSELDFEDTLTASDTVIYDLDNLVRNDGSAVPANLLDDSYGYVVVSTTDFTDYIVGNFRIIDINNYEYRSNMVGTSTTPGFADETKVANFNTIEGAMYADVIGYAFEGRGQETVTNIEEGYSFDIFVFDLDEEPLSCDRRNFACGNVMVYGINEDYMASRGNDLLCPGGGLSDPRGGFVSLENGANLDFDGNNPDNDDDDIFIFFIGINNNNGTGSMDIWFDTSRGAT